ncbi:MAG: VTT domain-containing protein [Geminicoccaceae bacterium]
METRTSETPALPILREGETCWRRCRADRTALLVDGAAYFAALRAALLAAEERVTIVGWDIRADLVLDPDHPGETLRDLLERLVRERPKLRVRILIWDWIALYAFNRQPLPWWHLDVMTDPRIEFRLDSVHPAGGCQHEKVVAIDGTLAFVGGIDLSAGRWDTPAHRPDEPLRGGRPIHDAALMVDGEAAAAVELLALDRWQAATATRVWATPVGSDPWPVAVRPDFAPTEVAIARTRPPHGRLLAAREIEPLYLAAIAAARTSIHIENQYLTVERIADALAARLAEPDGPEVVIVTPKACEGVVETVAMDIGRARFLRAIRRAAGRDRRRVFCLRTGERADVNVHAKLMIVDDRLVTVGSANLANRSMGLDSECNLAVEAPGGSPAIRRLRARLLAEHLQRDEAEVLAGLERHGGRSLPVIEALGPGRLRDLRLELPAAVRSFAGAARIADPDAPLTPVHVAHHLARPAQRRRLRDRVVPWALAAAVLVVVALVAGSGLLTDHGWIDGAFALAERYGSGPAGAAIVLGAFTLGSQLLVPITLLIALTAATMGPWLGFVYALLGAQLAAMLTFAIGRALGRERVRRLAGRRLASVSQRVGAHGIVAMALLRLVPIAPFSLVNLAAGISEMRLRDFVAGNFLGLLPGVALATAVGDGLGRWLRDPDPLTLALLVGGVIALLGLTWLLQAWGRLRLPA